VKVGVDGCNAHHFPAPLALVDVAVPSLVHLFGERRIFLEPTFPRCLAGRQERAVGLSKGEITRVENSVWLDLHVAMVEDVLMSEQEIENRMLP
jgi:ABC-type uncharacterized transport system auxiliary subunit